MECVFCSIISGDIPNYTVYEDENVLSFLDIHPASEGHTLVIPKKHSRFIWDHSDDEYVELMLASKKIAAHIQSVIKPHRIGLVVDGGDVHHTHIHLLPLEENKGTKKTLNAQDLGTEADHEKLAALATKLKMS